MSKHYILGNGSIGCLYDSCEVYPTKQAALDSIFADDWWHGVKSDLRQFGISYNPHPTSLEYLELTECYCNNPNQHSDN
jgi:hypothetical protein